MLEKGKHHQPIALGKLDVHKQKNEIRPIPITLCKTYSEVFKTLNVKHETSRRKHRQCSTSSSVGKAFLDRTPFAQKLSPAIDKCGFLKVKSFCTAKKSVMPSSGGVHL